MNARKLLQRFLLPRPLITLYMFCKYRCFVSPRAEIELSRKLKIGKGSQIGSFCKVKATDGLMTIGRDVSIGAGCFISSHAGSVEIGNDCLIGPNVSIIANSYRYSRLDVPIRLQGDISKGIQIGDDVWIGAGVCLLDGASIGPSAIIAANSVITNHVPANAVVQGNPAKVVFYRR